MKQVVSWICLTYEGSNSEPQQRRCGGRMASLSPAADEPGYDS